MYTIAVAAAIFVFLVVTTISIVMIVQGQVQLNDNIERLATTIARKPPTIVHAAAAVAPNLPRIADVPDPATAYTRTDYELVKHRYLLPVTEWAAQDPVIPIVTVNLDPGSQVSPAGKSKFILSVPNEEWIRPSVITAVNEGKADYFSALSRQLTDLFPVPLDGVIIDVGCNMGIVSLPYTVGKGNEVICVEPIPINCRSLARSASLNNITDRYHILCGAASKAPGETEIFVPHRSDNSALGSAAATKNVGGNAERVKVPLYSLDSVLVDFPRRNKIMLIKVDVQGYELNVLHGLREILTKYEPVVEVENDEGLAVSAGFSTRQVHAFMDSLGYKAYCGTKFVPKEEWPPTCYDITWQKNESRW